MESTKNNVRSGITSVGMFYPETVLTNEYFAKKLDTTDEWITERTGIKERHIATNGLTTSEMGYRAAKKALDTRGMKAEDIECIIVASVTPDMIFPSTACLIQNKLGMKNGWGFDLPGACSGFIFALSVADQFIKTGKHKRILVIGSDTMSSIINYEDRATCVLFGDGAAAIIVEPVEEQEGGIIDTLCRIDGSGGKYLYMPGGGSLNPPTHETVDKKMHYVHQEGKAVFKYAVNEMANISTEILEKNNLSFNDITLFIPHQANFRIIDAVGKKLNLPESKVLSIVDRYANTTSATIPTGITYAIENKIVKKNDVILLSTFGAGFSWGSILLKWCI